MTLQQVIREIEKAANVQPSINMIVRHDVFRLNSAPSCKYGVFAWLQGQHSGNVNGMMNYQFTFFYVDRLREDLSNQTEIHSVGCETLSNVIRLLEEVDIYAESFTLQPFNQRFTDQCAGVYANVTFQVSADYLCGEALADYNNDFNEDFLIY